MRTFIGIALLSLCAASIPAFAQTEDSTAAKVRYESGVKHFDLAEYEPALADFKEAYRQKSDPVFLYNIAQCHRKLGHTDDAITFYQNYLRRAPDARNRAEVERRLAELETLRAAENAAAAPGSKIQPAPAAEQVAGPVYAPIGPGVPPAYPAAAPAAALPATAQPAGAQSREPTMLSLPTPAPTAVPPAASVAETAAPGPMIETASPGHGLRVAGVACAALGLASIGTAVYFYTRALSLSDKVNNSDAPSPLDHEAGKNAQTMQWVFYGAGAAAVATGSLLYYLGWRAADLGPSANTVAPWVAPGMAGLAAKGAF